MKLKQWLLVALFGCGMAMLAACSTTKSSDDEAAISDANSSGNGGAQTAGLGEEGGLAGGGQTGLAKRTYYFEYDSSNVEDGDKAAIIANANYLAGHPNKQVIVEGHTDPRGSREYNIGLGERRANSVAEILRAHGVSSNQLRVVSYGAQRLAAQGRSESSYQLDRRVVLAYQG